MRTFLFTIVLIFSFLFLLFFGIYVGQGESSILKGGKGKVKEQNIKLPRPRTTGKMSLEEAIIDRQSVRSFSKQELSPEEISQLLWAAYGPRDVDSITGASKTVPSAGALYPMEIYIVSPNGVFHYFPSSHSLKEISDRDLRSALSGAALWQEAIAQAAVDFVIACVYDKICWKYGERGMRYAHIEAGHIAQNIHLQAVCLGLGSVPIGAFSDTAVQKALYLPKDNIPLYIIPVGHPK
ncbi:SagB/ThcOx family dehydrogenase [bacterium]|nr:SagB/ThcOx family dehydrogenase [bacterium]NIN92388.1 SagB/ThcOx family dehydrogenase [bacterium]NIO18502.1 SagB/ThcOx family dehydrogenase [bacterium]NIO73498.1 SagB/ThcOx family dehydrogenase [bacterium]